MVYWSNFLTHTVLSNCLGKGHHNITVKLWGHDLTWMKHTQIMSCGSTLSWGGRKVTFPTCSSEQSCRWPGHIPYFVTVLAGNLYRPQTQAIIMYKHVTFFTMFIFFTMVFYVSVLWRYIVFWLSICALQGGIFHRSHCFVCTVCSERSYWF